MGPAAPEARAAVEQRSLDLTIRPLDIHLRDSGLTSSEFGQSSIGRSGLVHEQRMELAIQAGSLGVSLRPEGNRLKPDVFYDVSGWRLRTRILSGDSPLEIEGMLLRAAHALPLFGLGFGKADLP